MFHMKHPDQIVRQFVKQFITFMAPEIIIARLGTKFVDRTMTPSEYREARKTLNLTHKEMAEVLGVKPRSSYRYAGKGPIPRSIAQMVRLILLDFEAQELKNDAET